MDTDTYYMGIALAVREKANCLGRKVGAVLVKDNRIISTGYNGTPEAFPNCQDGGCHRCSNAGKAFASGEGYDVCICVHAEANAILSSARFGVQTTGATMYSTLRPCFDCTKAMLQAKVGEVVFLHEWSHPDERNHAPYRALQSHFEVGVRQHLIEDPRQTWANGGS